MSGHGARFFDGCYLRLLDADRPAAATRAEVERVLRVLRLAPGSRILDLGCGSGRHAAELARRGHRVLGIDMSAAMIGAARRRHGRRLRLEFLRQDLRALDRVGEFDAVLALFNSFGHFPARDDRPALLRMARALRPGGKVLIEHRDAAFDARRLPPRQWWRTRSGLVVLQEARFEAGRGVARFDWQILRPGRRGIERRRIELRERTLAGWRALLARAGLELIASQRDADSPRLVLLAAPRATPAASPPSRTSRR